MSSNGTVISNFFNFFLGLSAKTFVITFSRTVNSKFVYFTTKTIEWIKFILVFFTMDDDLVANNKRQAYAKTREKPEKNL